MPTDFSKINSVKQIGQSGTLFCMDREPNSGRVVFGSSDRQVYSADSDGEKVEPLAFGAADNADASADGEQPEKKSDAQPMGQQTDRHVSYVMGIAIAGNFVVSGGFDRRLIWWDRKTRKAVKVIGQAHTKWLRGVVASPDGTWVASVADDMVCRIWDVKTQTLKHELKGHKEKTPQDYWSMLHAVTVSPDSKHLATGDKVGHIVVWDVATGKEVKSFESPENYTWDPKQRRHSAGGLRSLAFSPDGKQLAVGGIGQIGNIDGLGASALIQVYDWQKGERTHRFAHTKHKGLVEHLQFHHESEWLMAGGGAGGGFLLWMDLSTSKFVHDVDAKFHVHSFQLNEASDRVYAVGYTKLAVWELPQKSNDS